MCWPTARSAGSRCSAPTSAGWSSRGGAQALIESLNQKTNDLSGGALTSVPVGDQTVATGVAGEPTAPGRRSGGPVNRKRLRLLARSQSASSVR